MTGHLAGNVEPGIMKRFGAIRRYQRKVGMLAGTKWFVLRALNFRKLLPRRIVLRMPRLMHPVTLRTGDSSDFDVFTQVVLWPEYDFLDRLIGVRAAIDLGANIGLASATILSRFPNARTIAVEPDPNNCAMLRTNLAPYGRRAHVLEGAVWSKDGEVSLDNSFGDRRDWAVAVKEGKGVRAFTMPQILSHFRSDEMIDLLKIDIEGSETALFSGDVSWLARVRNLCIELHGADCERVFRAAMASYRWQESRSGEYVLCEGIEKVARIGTNS